MTLLYWCTSIAYNRVVKIDQTANLPLFHSQQCIITHLDLQQANKFTDDLSIYYSGVKKVDDLPQQPVVKHDEKIQEEILKVVKEKQQNKQNESVKSELSKDVQYQEKKVDKKIVQPKISTKTQPRVVDDDTFSPQKIQKKPDNKLKNQPKKNVFDVIE